MAKKKTDHLDWGAPLTPRTSSITYALSAVAVTGFGTTFGVPWEPVIAAGAAISASTYGAHLMRKRYAKPHITPKTLAAIWAAWTVEVAAAIGTDPHTWTLTHFWIAAPLFVTTWALSWWALDRADIIDEAYASAREGLTSGTPEEGVKMVGELLADRARATLATEWINRINDVLNFRPEAISLTPWEEVNGTSPGFTLGLQLPTKGASSQSFNDVAVLQLAEHAALPNGCGITTSKGDRQGQILLHVETVNPNTLVHDHPGDWSPLTINKPIPMTLTPHGKDITVRLREAGVIIAGTMGTGKTTLLNSTLAALARCTDVLVWGVDVGKQGKAFRDWTTGLPDGTKPLVRRVASTYQEALDLVEAAQRLANKRAAHFGTWQQQNDADLVPVSSECPMIFLVFDESAEIFSYTGTDKTQMKLKEATLQLMRTSREAGVRTILTFVDLNVTSTGSTDMWKFSPVKISLVGNGLTADETNAMSMFGRVKGVDLRQLTAKGQGIGNLGNGPQVMRGYRTKPSMIRECTVATSGHRPDYHPVDLDAMGDLQVPEVYIPRDENRPAPAAAPEPSATVGDTRVNGSALDGVLKLRTIDDEVPAIEAGPASEAEAGPKGFDQF